MADPEKFQLGVTGQIHSDHSEFEEMRITDAEFFAAGSTVLKVGQERDENGKIKRPFKEVPGENG